MMPTKQLSPEQKKLDADLWIIALVTFAVFALYATFADPLMSYVAGRNEPIVARLLLNAGLQYGIAGLGITIVCILRRESFSSFGLKKEKAIHAILGTIACYVPYIIQIFASGRFAGYQPLSVMVTDDVLAAGIPFSIAGMLLIALVWGFFEGFNYAVISEKINRRYPAKGLWMDYGAIICAMVCVLVHPIRFSFWGLMEMITAFAAIYGMLIVKRKTGNAWGCVFAFLFIWNAL